MSTVESEYNGSHKISNGQTAGICGFLVSAFVGCVGIAAIALLFMLGLFGVYKFASRGENIVEN